MEVMATISRLIPISPTDLTQTGNARRQALSLAAEMDFDELRQGQLGIIVTEAAGNIAAHAGAGEIILSAWTYEGRSGIDMLALDKGQGIENLTLPCRMVTRPRELRAMALVPCPG